MNTSRVTLTAPQLAALRGAAAHTEGLVFVGPTRHSRPGWTYAHWRTLGVLAKAGLIQYHGPGGQQITDAGRTYLAEI